MKTDDRNVTSALNEPADFMQVCAYACPPTEWNPQPFEYKPIFTEKKTMTMKEYKEKFIELFKQMEQEHHIAKQSQITLLIHLLELI